MAGFTAGIYLSCMLQAISNKHVNKEMAIYLLTVVYAVCVVVVVRRLWCCCCGQVWCSM